MLLARFAFSSLLSVGLCAQSSVFCIDSVTDNLMALDHRSGEWTVVGSTANNGLSTPADLTWRRLTGEMWTIDYSGGELGTLDLDDGTFTPRYVLPIGGWQGLAWHEQDKLFYLANQSGFLYSYDPRTAFSSLIGAHGVPSVGSLDTDRFGELFAASVTGSIAKINRTFATSTVLATVDFGTTAIAHVAPTGQFLAINATAMDVRRYSSTFSTLEESAPLTTGLTLPRGLEIAERSFSYFYGEDSQIYAAETTYGSIFRVSDSAGWSVVDTAPRAITWRSTAHELWTVALDGRVGVFQRDGSWDFRHTTKAGSVTIDGFFDIAYDARTDGFYLLRGSGEIWWMAGNSSQVSFRGFAGHPLRALTVGEFGDLYAMSSPSDGNNLYLLDTATAAPTLLASGFDACRCLEYDRSTGDFLSVLYSGELQRITPASWNVETVSNQFQRGERSYLTSAGGTLTFVDETVQAFAIVQLAPAYVCDELTDDLGTLNLATGAATVVSSTDDNGLIAPGELTHFPGREELWTVDIYGGEIGTIDPETGWFEVYCNTGYDGFHAIAWHEIDQYFYLGNANGEIYVLEPISGDIALLGHSGYAKPLSLDVDDAGNLFMMDHATGTLTRVDRGTGVATPVTSSLIWVQGFGIEPGTGDLLAVRSVDDSLYRIDPDTGAHELVGPFTGTWDLVRGIELIDAAGPTVARTLIAGQACGDLALSTQETPRLYTQWTMTLASQSQLAFAIMLLGFDDPTLPLDFLGAPGCVLFTDALSTIVVPQPLSYTLGIPANTELLGVTVHAQGLMFEQQANPLGMVFSNGLKGVIGY